MDRSHEIELSISRRFRHKLWGRFVKAVKDYQLIKENDVIAVCISGGKDSMLMAKLIQQLKRNSEVPFEAVYIVMDPGYNKVNRKKIEDNAKLLEVPVTFFETDIFEGTDNTVVDL